MVKKIANRKQWLKIIGAWLLIDGILSIYFLNLLPQPSTGLDFALLIRFIRAGIGIYLIWV